MDSTTNSSKSIVTGAAIGLIALFFLFFMFCFRIVGVGQVGIITRFGNINREVGSGVLIKAPWPIEHITKMNIRTQKEQQDAAAATKDLQTVTATIALNYNLTPKTAFDVYRNIGTKYQETVLDPILQNSIKAVTSQYDAADLIAKRPEVEKKLDDLLAEKLTNKGITVDNVSIVNFNFSAEFNASIEQKQVAQQNAQKAQYELQTATTQAQAQDVQAKTLTSEYLTLQAINKWNGVLPTTLAGSNTVFGIPIK